MEACEEARTMVLFDKCEHGTSTTQFEIFYIALEFSFAYGGMAPLEVIGKE